MITGFTGSGKSAFIESMLISTLYYSDVDNLRVILFDPKVVEYSGFKDFPQLAIPIVTDTRKGIATLEWLCEEMHNRYEHYHEWNKCGTSAKPADIIFVIDEFADLMMVDGNKTEETLIRLLQVGRSVGIHIVLATQCMNYNCFSPLLRANCKTEIHFYQDGNQNAFMNSQGEESLMGLGDMLFFRYSWDAPQRIQGPFISSEEIDNVMNYLIELHGRAKYDDQIEERIMQYEARM